MKASDLENLGTEELIERYRDVAAKHGRLLNARKSTAANKEYDLAAAIRTELLTRGAVAQQHLLRLLGDPEPGTRYWAATAALKFAPDEAEGVLAGLATPPMTLVGLSAALALEEWRARPDKHD